MLFFQCPIFMAQGPLKSFLFILLLQQYFLYFYTTTNTALLKRHFTVDTKIVVSLDFLLTSVVISETVFLLFFLLIVTICRSSAWIVFLALSDLFLGEWTHLAPYFWTLYLTQYFETSTFTAISHTVYPSLDNIMICAHISVLNSLFFVPIVLS